MLGACWAQILAYGASGELTQDQSPGIAAASGSLGFKVLTSCDPAAQTKKLNDVLTNGRELEKLKAEAERLRRGSLSGCTAIRGGQCYGVLR